MKGKVSRAFKVFWGLYTVYSVKCTCTLYKGTYSSTVFLYLIYPLLKAHENIILMYNISCGKPFPDLRNGEMRKCTFK